MTIINEIILKNLIHDHEYNRKVIPYIKEDYFSSSEEKFIFKVVNEFVAKYNKPPTIESLAIEIDAAALPEKIFDNTVKLLTKVKEKGEDIDPKFLLEKTEAFCKERAMFNAIHKSIQILEGNDKHLKKEAIPSLMESALAVSFDYNLGHDFIEDYKERWDKYHAEEAKIPFGVTTLDEVTKGGMGRKTLNMILAPTGGGKTALLCNVAANNLCEGKNVLYISLEMDENEISKRVDVNLMDVTFDDLGEIPFDQYERKILDIKRKPLGKLIVKEYPTGVATANHIRAFLNELKLKRGLDIDLLVVDYLGLMDSARLKGGTANAYSLLKSISEEVRGIAVEYDLAILTAGQFNRGGNANNSDPSEADIADSFGVLFACDFVGAIIVTEEMIKESKIVFKQIKSRYDDKNKKLKFSLYFERDKMRIEGVDSGAYRHTEAENEEYIDMMVEKTSNFEGFKF